MNFAQMRAKQASVNHLLSLKIYTVHDSQINLHHIELVGTLKDKFSFSCSIMRMFSPPQCCVKKSSYRTSNEGIMLFQFFFQH